MLFNSIGFMIYLPIVVAGYFILRHKWRWLWLLIASYFFYMVARPEYAILLFGSTLLDYWCAIKIDKQPTKERRKPYLYLSLIGNLGTLLIFKYLGFFNELIRDLTGFSSIEYPIGTIDILLPIGISFYTFQSLSYTIDVYRKTRPAERHLGLVALYVSFFPQLVAGPIETSTQLLPQFKKEQHFKWQNLIDGLKLILWGIFKKVVLADKMGHYVNKVYGDIENYHGFSFVIVGCAFFLQVLFDFGAYTDIAVGSAKIFGIDLNINFYRPFRSTSMKQFWQRWHMSLTKWFFEYLYKPLSRKFRKGWQINMLLFMIVIGFWHGPSWGFLVFGLMHGLFYIISDYLPEFASKKNKLLDVLLKGIAMVGLFLIVASTGFFFRAASISEAFYAYLEAGKGLISFDYSIAEIGITSVDAIIILVNLILYFIVQNLPNHDPKKPFVSVPFKWFRWGLYYYMLFMICSLAHTKTQEFLYFHF